MKKYLITFSSHIRKISSKIWVILGIIIVIIFMFFWEEIRPVIAKTNCYKDARIQAINLTQKDKSEPFLYDRQNWINYKKYTSGNFWGTGWYSPRVETSEPAFEDNIKTGIEPSYIQEHLDEIKKENDFSDTYYDKFYKRCLQSKGL